MIAMINYLYLIMKIYKIQTNKKVIFFFYFFIININVI